MSADESQPELESSRLPRCNSVKPSTPENPAFHESESYDDRVAEQAAERVAEFREEYPHLANRPISETPGQTLRAELVEHDRVEEHVEPEREWESGFTIDRTHRAEPVTWAETLYRFLTARQAYDDGLGGVFESRVDGERFTVDFDDCWTSSYGDEQAAKNAAFQRQLMGGTYPDNPESARAGEHVEGEWGDVATIMLTRTGSAAPDGEHLPPVDHDDAVLRTWSNGGVYDVVRNACEYHLGLESEQWVQVRGDDVHGLGAADDPDKVPGVNACYSHSHDAIYIDLEATGLREKFGTDEEIITVLENTFYPAIEKHVEECDYAKPEGHTREKAIEVRLDLDEPAGYATKYLRLQEDKPMMEMPVEMQAFASIKWAANRQRISRSKIANDAAKADLCLQDKDRAHGHRLKYNKHGDVVCAHCGSGVGIDAETITEHRLSQSAAQRPSVAADGGVENAVVVGARYGESPAAARVRSRVEEYVEAHGEPESIAELMGALGVQPQHKRVVQEVLAGENTAEEVEPIYGEPPELPPEYELVEIVNPDGTTEPAGSGGGVNLAELVLPEQRLLRETRLQYVGEAGYPHMRCEKTGFSTYDPETMAGYLVEKCGVREPWHAEVVLEFSPRRDDRDLAEEFEEPAERPPEGVGSAES